MLGLDKQVIKPKVIGIDYDRLTEEKNVVVSTEGITTELTDITSGERVKISHIIIKDNIMFNRLKIGVVKSSGIETLYCYLEINRMGAGDCNLVPYTVEGFKKHTDKCLEYIEDRYGVMLDKNGYKLEQMEINITIEIEEKFKEYGYLLELIGSLSAGGRKRYRCEFYKDRRKECTGIKLSSKSRSKKIYDKTKQLNEEKEIKVKIEKNYMRIEDTIIGQDRIKGTFGTEYLENITQKDIEEYIKKTIVEDIINPLEKHIKQGDKILKKIAKEEKERDIRKWKRIFIYRAGGLRDKQGIPVVVDVQQILEVIKKESPKNYSRDRKRLNEEIENLGYLEGNYKKIEEIKRECKIVNQ